jgi:hypothetical protein
MAKLNGIQVIDMVGGEVTKIAYNGEEYAKVAEREDGEKYPKAGDIALRASTSSFIDKGGYYEVDSLPDGVNPRLVGHSGGYFERENFDFFRKAAPAPATKPASSVKVGDKIRIVACDDYRYKNGDEMAVSDVREDGAVYVNTGGRSDVLVFAREFEVIADKPSETDARISDLEQRVTALESAKPAQSTPTYRKVTGRSPQVGDYVKYDEAPRSYVLADKYYEIIRIDGSDDPHILDEDGDDWDTVNDSSFEVYEKVKQAQDDAQQPLKEENTALRVGDYAKVIREDKFTVGEIIEIVGVDSLHFEAKSLQRDYWHYADKERELIPATAEEVAEAKRQAEKDEADRKLTAKFTEIGRKPGEFKAGDIVKYLGGASRKSSLVEVFEDTSAGRTSIRWTDDYDICSENNDDLELITPVERRFDRG